MAASILSPTPASTEALGERLGAALRPGDRLSLRGPLGAGKTLLTHGLVRGYLRALGVRDTPRVCSPSYTIINSYEHDPAFVYHIDLYRLRDIDDLETTGYWDVLDDPEGVALIEWLEQVEGAAPERYVEIALHVVDPGSPHDAPRRLELTEHHAPELFARLRSRLDAADA